MYKEVEDPRMGEVSDNISMTILLLFGHKIFCGKEFFFFGHC